MVFSTKISKKQLLLRVFNTRLIAYSEEGALFPFFQTNPSQNYIQIEEIREERLVICEG